MKGKTRVSVEVHHSQESTVPTLHSPTNAILNSQSRDVFQRLTVSRAQVDSVPTPSPFKPRSRGWSSDHFQEEMLKKLHRSQAKIKALRDQIEKESMKQMRPKPRISVKSKELAAKVNERFFAKYRGNSGIEEPGKDKENEGEKTGLEEAMELLEPEDCTNNTASIKASLRDRIQQYLRTPSVHSRRSSVSKSVPQVPRAHRRLSTTLSPVVRQVSFDSGCDLSRHPAKGA